MAQGTGSAQGNPFDKMLEQAAAQTGQPVSGEAITCDECGERATMLPPIDIAIMADGEHIKMYSFKGAAGACREGPHLICWKHIEFKNLDAAFGDTGRYVLACKQHGEQVEGVSADEIDRWRTAISAQRFMQLDIQDPVAAQAYLQERIRSLPPPTTPEEEMAREELKNLLTLRWTDSPRAGVDPRTVESVLEDLLSPEEHREEEDGGDLFARLDTSSGGPAEKPKGGWFRRRRQR